MDMRLSIYILFFLFCVNYHSQIKISGKITNQDAESISDVKIFLSTNNKVIKRSLKNGEFSISISSNANGELIFDHVAYQQYSIKIDKKFFKKYKSSSAVINIELKNLELNEFVVGAKQKPKIIYGTQENSVSDFLFVDDKLLLLSYSKSIEKDPILKLVSQNQELLCEYNCPKDVIKLFTDFEEKHYLITKKKIYLISVFKKEIRLREIEKKQFDEFTSLILDTLNQQYIYSNFSDAYPAFDFFHQSIYAKNAITFHHIEDEFMMELYRSEYKYAPPRDKLWALRQEVETGIDKEIWIGARSFTGSLYYKTPYAPLFLLQDTIRIFDHYKDFMFIYDSSFSIVDSIKINYHKSKEGKRNWQQPLLKDLDQNKIYALFKSGGYNYLKDIDFKTGETSTAFKLYHKYTEQIKLKDGYAYYIYRPYQSIQRKYLYREKIIAN